MPDLDPRAPLAGSAALPGQPRLLSRRGFLALSAAAAAATAATTRSGTARGAAAAGRVGGGGGATPGLSPKKLDSIVRVAIHPGVGIARVGNSADAFFIGPEVAGATPPPPADLRDAQGAVARQAARFRIYGYDAEGRVVGEVRAMDARIDWSVHLANRKAAWYRFERAMDIPGARSQGRRNASANDRSTLVLNARRQSTSEGTPVELTAKAKGVTMLLGELLTDSAGRLIVLPGRGRAVSWKGTPVTTYANNDAWLDDTADGPVTATVTIGKRTLEATPAWVATGPPNFAPGLATGWRTMHDLVEDTWVRAGWIPRGDSVSFQDHIRPLFTRLAELQWVNAGVLRDHGWKSDRDLSDPAFLARLANPSAANRAFRERWADRFRDLPGGGPQPDRLPPILGDDAGNWNVSRAWTAPTKLQHHRLAEWAAGRFESDSIEAPETPAKLADLPLGRRPRSLDRAALEACLGEAFAPGCELPWAMRRRVLWQEPYRIKVRQGPEPDFGSVLTPQEAIGKQGPLDGSVPGSLTRWMALPWQTDTVNCRAGYRPSIDPLLDTFWAGRVPNHVLTQRDYAIVMDTDRPLSERRTAFRRRRDWLRGMITSDYVATLNRMVNRWHALGFVVVRPGPDGSAFPDTIGVEVARRLPEPRFGAEVPAPVLPWDVEDPA